MVLLGQTVNSYWDRTTPSSPEWRARLPLLRQREGPESGPGSGSGSDYAIAEGFTQRSKPKPRPRPVQGQGQGQGQVQESTPDHDVDPASASASASAPALDTDTDTDLDADLDLDCDPEGGVRFAELLARVAAIDPKNMRIRFQSPHPKDFPDEVLRLIASTPNICNSLHMPAQHGSTAALARMHRGYSREAYVELVRRARRIIAPDVHAGAPPTTLAAPAPAPAAVTAPAAAATATAVTATATATAAAGGSADTAGTAGTGNAHSDTLPPAPLPLPHGIGLGLSSDFIAGFCGETDEEHEEHLSLLREVGRYCATCVSLDVWDG